MKQEAHSAPVPQAHLFENLVVGLQEASRLPATNWLDAVLLRRGLNGLAVALPTPPPHGPGLAGAARPASAELVAS